MAFNTQEQSIIKWGLDNGKSKEDVTKAITNYRMGTPTQTKPSVTAPVTPTTPSFTQRATGVVNKAGGEVSDAIAGKGNYAGETPIRRGVEATAKAFTAPLSVAKEALPEPARKAIDVSKDVIGKGFNWLIDQISDSPALQKAVMSHPKIAKAVEEIAGTGAAAGEIAGDILAYKGIADTGNAAVKKITDIVKPKAPVPPNPTIKIGGKELTLDQIHSEQGRELMKNLSAEDQLKLSKFDQEQSLVKQISDFKSAGKDTTDLQSILDQHYKANASEALKTLPQSPEKVTLYRGQTPGTEGHGYFTTDPNMAKNFGGKDGEILQGNLPAGSKIIDTTSKIASSNPDVLLADNIINSGGNVADVYDHFWKNGYDAVISTGNRGETQVVVNPKNLGAFSAQPISSTAAPSAIAGGMVSGAKEAIGTARTKIEDLVNPIAKNVETVLKETPKPKLDEYVNVARKATENSKNITPLEVVGKKAGTALDTIQTKLDQVGKAKQAILDDLTTGVGNKKVGPLMIRFRQGLRTALEDETLVAGDKNMVNDIIEESKKLGDNPTAKKVDKFVDYIQSRVYTGSRDLSVPVTDKITSVIRKQTGILNKGLKNQLPESYSTLNSRYADLVGTRDELNLKLGKEGERAGALMKRVFSPSDANTKELFAKVLEETGVDLVNEAVLAKYVMETLGDARQASLLEQALGRGQSMMTKNGIISDLLQKAKGVIQNPEANIRKARRMTTGGETTPDRLP